MITAEQGKQILAAANDLQVSLLKVVEESDLFGLLEALADFHGALAIVVGGEEFRQRAQDAIERARKE